MTIVKQVYEKHTFEISLFTFISIIKQVYEKHTFEISLFTFLSIFSF